MSNYKCDNNCKPEFTEEDFKESMGFCPKCKTGMLHPIEEAIAEPASVLPTQGECGLGILVLDLSSSMTGSAFDDTKYPEYQKQRKIDLVSHAIGDSLPKMRNMSTSENAYIAIIGFAENAELLEVKRASEIDDDVEYWIDWTIKKQEEIEANKTNITAALELARKLYDSALKGKMDKFRIENFSLMYHDINVEGNIVPVANVRVFLYSDGEHNVGPFINHFEDTSLIPGKSNISGLITAYFGNPNNNGYKLLEGIAGVCPRHNVKGVMHITSPEGYPRLRQTFHMASAASGFCAECAKEFKEPKEL